MPGFNLSKKAALHLRKNLNLSEDDQEIAAYSFEIIILGISQIAAICLATWLFGCLPTALTGIMAASLLRLFSGGAHSESPVNCTLISVVIAVLIGKIAVIFGNQISVLTNLIFILFVLLISIRTIWVLAPVDTPAKPITDENHRKKLRRLSLIAVISLSSLQLFLITFNPSIFAQYSLAASLGLSWQTFSLTPAGHQFGYIIDSILNKIIRR